MATSTELIDLLNDLAEFLEDQADVRDGSYGEQVPNRAMQLYTRVEEEVARLERSFNQEEARLRAIIKQAIWDLGKGRADMALVCLRYAGVEEAALDATSETVSGAGSTYRGRP